jgi:hypothetical protein
MTSRTPLIPRTLGDWLACLSVTALLSIVPLAYLFL